jgi:hypothetical protein
MTDTSGKGTQPYGSVTVVSDDVYFWPACPFLCVEQVKSTLLFLHLPSQATFWLMEGILDSYI